MKHDKEKIIRNVFVVFTLSIFAAAIFSGLNTNMSPVERGSEYVVPFTTVQKIRTSALPSAAFTINDTTIHEGQSALFTHTGSNGTDPTVLAWNFGDGTANVTKWDVNTHEFQDNGTFTVTLYMIDDASATDKVTHTITVAPYFLNITCDTDWSLLDGVTGNGSRASPWTMDYGNVTLDTAINIQDTNSGVYALVENVNIVPNTESADGDVLVDNAWDVSFFNVNVSCITGYNIVNSNHVSISNSTITNCTSYGIYVENCLDVDIYFCNITDVNVTCIYLEGNIGMVIFECEISQGVAGVATTGIAITDCESVIVMETEIYDMVTQGILITDNIDDSTDLSFENVDVQCLSTGLYLTGTRTNASFLTCRFSGGDYGMVLDSNYGDLYFYDATIMNNAITSLSMNDVGNTIIVSSYFDTSDCTSGNPIYLVDCTNIEFGQCTFTASYVAFNSTYMTDSFQIIFDGCDFYNNSIEMHEGVECNVTSCTFDGYSYADNAFNALYAMMFDEGYDILVTDCVISNTVSLLNIAIAIFLSENVNVTNCNGTNGVVGIAILSSVGVAIERCNLQDYLGYSLYIDGSFCVIVNDSTFISSLTPVVPYVIATYTTYTSNESLLIYFTNNHVDCLGVSNAFSLPASSFVVVENNTIENAISAIIFDDTIYSDALMFIVNNTISNCTSGISITAFGVLTIQNNTFINVNGSIDCVTIDTLGIYSNTIVNDNGVDAISITDCTYINIDFNEITCGINVMFDAIYVLNSLNVTITSNYCLLMIQEDDEGIELDTCDEVLVMLNLFDNCTLIVDTCTNDNYDGNAFWDYFTQTGVSIFGWDEGDILPVQFNATGCIDLYPFYSVRLFGVSDVLITITAMRLNATGDIISSANFKIYANGVLTTSSFDWAAMSSVQIVIKDRFGITMYSHVTVTTIGNINLTVVLQMNILTVVNNLHSTLDFSVKLNGVLVIKSANAHSSAQLLLFDGTYKFSWTAPSTGSMNLAVTHDQKLVFNPTDFLSVAPPGPSPSTPEEQASATILIVAGIIAAGVGGGIIVVMALYSFSKKPVPTSRARARTQTRRE